MGTVSVWLGLSPWLVLSTAAVAAPLPPLPDPPTVEGCESVRLETFERLQGVQREQAACLRQRAQFGPGAECMLSQRGWYVRQTLLAWSQCDQAAELCALQQRLDESYGCLRQARRVRAEQAGLQRELQRLADQQAELRNLTERGQQLRKLYDDPRAFIKDHVEDRLWQRVKSELLGRDGELSASGRSSSQTLYDFIFNHGPGDPALLSGNPLIQAFQGAAVDEIRAAHAQSLVQLDTLAETLDRFGAESPAPGPAAAGSAASDCSAIAGTAGLSLMQDDPARFDALVLRCR